jgi:hypothetical protein
VEENILVFETRQATRGVVTFYSAGVVTQDNVKLNFLLPIVCNKITTFTM